MGMSYSAVVLYGIKCKDTDIFDTTTTQVDKTQSCTKDSGWCPLRGGEDRFCSHCGAKREDMLVTREVETPTSVVQEFFGAFDPEKQHPREWMREVENNGELCILDEGGYSDGSTLYIGLMLSNISPREGEAGQISLTKIRELEGKLLELALKLNKPLTLHHFTQVW